MAVAVDDDAMLRAVREIGSAEGLFVCPEGGACYAALKLLLAAGRITPDEWVVLFNTGAGVKYLECFPGGPPP
jgi:threonine synthase